MSFWESFKKNVSDAADYTVKKTEALSEKINIKMAIRSAESKLNEHYEELGRLYYDTKKNGVNFDSDIAEKMRSIDASKEEIKKLKISLATAEGMTFCPKCGTQIDAQSIFCPVCGRKMSADDGGENGKDTASEKTEADGNSAE